MMRISRLKNVGILVQSHSYPLNQLLKSSVKIYSAICRLRLCSDVRLLLNTQNEDFYELHLDRAFHVPLELPAPFVLRSVAVTVYVNGIHIEVSGSPTNSAKKDDHEDPS